jgi:lipopolysaccharide transport system permease protein
MSEMSLQTKSQQEEVLYLKATSGWSAINLSELWRYRELIYFLIWRDIKVRYKQTVLGAAWAIIQPFFTMVVFTIFFGRLAKVPSDNVPYPIFSYTALLPWGMFTKALSDAGRSMISNRAMITKVYFPRLVIPLSSVLSGVVDFSIAFVVLLGMMVYYNLVPGSEYRIHITYAVWLLPLFILLALITALGVGLWLSALNVIYRDINYITPFLTQFWLFITPIAYPSSLIPEKWRLIYALNPMTGVVEGFRWALLGTETAPGPMLAVSTTIAIIVLVTGLFYFRRMERTFADKV